MLAKWSAGLGATDARPWCVSPGAGRQAAARVSGALAGVLERTAAPLSHTERDELERLISRVLVGLIPPPGAVR